MQLVAPVKSKSFFSGKKRACDDTLPSLLQAAFLETVPYHVI
jgi:hypothetical protein